MFIKSIVNFFLIKYQNSPLEVQKKSKIFLIINFSGILLLLSVSLIELIFGFSFYSVFPFMLGVIFSIIILFIFKTGHYELSCFLFIAGIFSVQTLAIIIDKYDNPFDIYRYAFTITSLILVTGVLSYSRKQVSIIVLLGIVGIIFFYIYRFGIELKKPFDTVVIITLIVSIFVFIFFGVLALLTLVVTKNIVKIAESREQQVRLERDETKRMLNIIKIYTKPSIVKDIQSGKDPTKFIPEKKEVVILFCDIRDFTNIIEKMEPSDVVEILNPYFAMMNAIIIENKGEIDKLMGDCIMAIFNNCDDALKASIEMRKIINNETNNSIKIKNGIGIHFGTVIIGNIGSPWKIDHTVIGDSVNVASRLESLTKIYHANIIISEAVKENLQNDYDLIELDIVMVKGRKAPIKIYGIYDEFSYEEKCIFDKNIEDLNKAFDYYINGNFTDAIFIYEKIIDELKCKNCTIPYIDFYKERCIELELKRKNGDLLNWDGIYEFKNK